MNETLGGYLLDMDRADLLQGMELAREEPEATPLLANPGGNAAGSITNVTSGTAPTDSATAANYGKTASV